MPIDSAWNAYIFRDGKTTVGGPRLVRELGDRLLAIRSFGLAGRAELTDLLLRAGELECALQDVTSPAAALAESITDAIATSLVSGVPLRSEELSQCARSLDVPETLQLATPEGFAYYSLHPLDFVDLVRRFAESRRAAVVGIRSIGTTLGALVQSALRADGRVVERITVRPTGHPYDRVTNLSPVQRQWVETMRDNGANFLVVDEGPGMSGSSFLSVGEALVNTGIPRARISFLCSREADPASLTAPNAAQRWPSFTAHSTQPTRHLPPRARHYIAGGIWRANVFSTEDEWPASWRQMERLKFLSEDGSLRFRFEGFGRFGESVYQRALQVASAGFGPAPLARDEGFGVYPMLDGRHMTPADANADLLKRLAEYCAFRAQQMPVQVTHTPELQTMLRFNLREDFGVELPTRVTELRIERPVIADGRMLPHAWIACGESMLKVDSATHGDDHFFPGPTDIAWDLAGAISEWNLSPEATAFFLNAYRRHSGDDPAERLPAYLTGYGVFRTAYCKMAAAATAGTAEAERFLRDFTRYHRQTSLLLRSLGAPMHKTQAMHKSGSQAA